MPLLPPVTRHTSPARFGSVSASDIARGRYNRSARIVTGAVSNAMDNVTHALFGVLVAEALHRTVPPSEPGLAPRDRRRSLVWLLVAGSNLPDLDFVYARITPGKLGYLLHHRGHSHTFVAALAFGALLFFTARVVLRRRSPSPSSEDQRL